MDDADDGVPGVPRAPHDPIRADAAAKPASRAPAVDPHKTQPCEHHTDDGRHRNGHANPPRASATHQRGLRPSDEMSVQPVYAALDLGTNNCRLLIARPSRRGFVVVDSFSRIIRLGEGLTQTGHLSDRAMKRTIDALRVCARKMMRYNVARARLVATQACRMADNGDAFIARVARETGLELEVLSQETEAQLAVAGCSTLLDRTCDMALVFDIGGGSSELVWLDLNRHQRSGKRADGAMHGSPDQAAHNSGMLAWTSLPVGVVTLAERFNGHHVTSESFEAMVGDVLEMLREFEQTNQIGRRLGAGRVHFLGTSGTVTTVAGIKLQLARYDRQKVDGCWLHVDEVRSVTGQLLSKSYEERCAEPCIGRDRADLVLAGCAILEALLRLWPTERLRVADRGLREGILALLMAEDGLPRSSRRRGRRRRGAATS